MSDHAGKENSGALLSLSSSDVEPWQQACRSQNVRLLLLDCDRRTDRHTGMHSIGGYAPDDDGAEPYKKS